MKTDIDVPSQLSDDDLLARVESLARCEREATVSLVAHLAELDARRLYLGAGFSSLFAYCCEVLHLSEPAAYNRIEVARAARGFPAILPLLAEGLLSLATVRLLASHLTVENQGELLAESSGAATATDTASLPLAPTTPAPPRRPLVVPLAPDRYEIRFTASAETRENLRLAQDLLRHAIPSGDPAQIIDRALKVLVEQLRRKKFAATDRPRASRGTAPGSRDVAAKVRRVVGLRDDGRCTFVGKSGRRCNERAFIEFHHDEPYGVGGEATAGNIQLLCRAHNAFESERFYGHGRPVKSATLPGKSSVLRASHRQSPPPP